MLSTPRPATLIKGQLRTVLVVRHTETSVLYSHAGESRSSYFVGDVTLVLTDAGGGWGLVKTPVQTEKKKKKVTPLPTQEPSRSCSALARSVSLGISL